MPRAKVPLYSKFFLSSHPLEVRLDLIHTDVKPINKQTIADIGWQYSQPISKIAIAKQIQWDWPQLSGEEKLVTLFDSLHIELTVL